MTPTQCVTILKDRTYVSVLTDIREMVKAAQVSTVLVSFARVVFENEQGLNSGYFLKFC